MTLEQLSELADIIGVILIVRARWTATWERWFVGSRQERRGAIDPKFVGHVDALLEKFRPA